VAEHDVDPSLSIKREDFEHLRGREISASAAERKYKINSENFSNWSKRGYIRKLGVEGRAILLDEADVAYCAAVYKAKYEFYDGQLSGVNIFDKEGRPYKLRYRENADMRRIKRRQEEQEKRAA